MTLTLRLNPDELAVVQARALYRLEAEVRTLRKLVAS